MYYHAHAITIGLEWGIICVWVEHRSFLRHDIYASEVSLLKNVAGSRSHNKQNMHTIASSIHTTLHTYGGYNQPKCRDWVQITLVYCKWIPQNSLVWFPECHSPWLVRNTVLATVVWMTVRIPIVDELSYPGRSFGSWGPVL